MTLEEKVQELEEILKDIKEIPYKCLGEYDGNCNFMLDDDYECDVCKRIYDYWKKIK